jgi:hypothetical protein
MRPELNRGGRGKGSVGAGKHKKVMKDALFVEIK